MIYDNPEFQQAMEDYRPFLFKNTDYDLFDWKDAIDVLDFSLKNNPDSIKNMRTAGYIMHEYCDRIPQVVAVMNDLKKAFNTHSHSANIYMALSSMTQGFGKHNDHMEVCFWQVIGQTQWTVYVTPTQKEIFVLSPRDILYVPPSMPHDVVSLSSRVGVSMAAEST